MHDGQVVNKGRVDSSMANRSARHPASAGVEALAVYIDEVQDVIALQGVKINDKHIEGDFARCCVA